MLVPEISAILSAILKASTHGLVSVSLILSSILATKSTPTSADLLKTPSPIRTNKEIIEPPSPNPAKASNRICHCSIAAPPAGILMTKKSHYNYNYL